MADVFISHAREDRDIAGRIASDLEANGISVWHDANLVPGERWTDIISDAIRSAKVFIPIVSSRSSERRLVGTEIAMAIAAAEKDKMRIIPVFLDEAGFSLPMVGLFHGVTIYSDDDYANGIKTIISAIREYGRNVDYPRGDEHQIREDIEDHLLMMSEEETSIYLNRMRKYHIQIRWSFLISGISGIAGALLAFNPALSEFLVSPYITFLIGFVAGAFFGGIMPILLTAVVGGTDNDVRGQANE